MKNKLNPFQAITPQKASKISAQSIKWLNVGHNMFLKSAPDDENTNKKQAQPLTKHDWAKYEG